jgi:hypothetical protein
MGLYDPYTPVPAIDCPRCGERLSGWQGKDFALRPAKTDRRIVEWLYWVGMGEKKWDCLAAGEEEKAAQIMGVSVSKFLTYLPGLIDGLSPTTTTLHWDARDAFIWSRWRIGERRARELFMAQRFVSRGTPSSRATASRE